MALSRGQQPALPVGATAWQGAQRHPIALLQQAHRHPRLGHPFEQHQQLHKGQGCRFGVIGRLADVIAEGQAQGRLLVIQPGRQHPRGIEQVEILAQAHPAQGAGDPGAAGAVHHLLAHQPVDQSRLAHIGETQHQGPHRPGLHPPPPAPFIEGTAGPNGGLLELLHPRACLGIAPPGGLALGAEPGVPCGAHRDRDHVEAVDHQQVLLALDPALQAGMARGQRDAGIAHLNHQIHLGEIGVERTLSLGNVAWIPLNSRGIDAELERQRRKIH